MRLSIAKAALIAAVLLIAPFAAHAKPQAPTVDAARNFVDTVASSALNTLKDPKQTTAQKQVVLEKLFSGAVDVPYVAKFVLGRYWRTASPAQQQAYMTAYAPFLIKNYVTRLTRYSGQNYTLTSSKPVVDGAMVGMKLVSTDGTPPVLVDYRLSKVGEGFKVVDISVEGVSLLNTQRSEFSSIISNKGLDYLVEALNKKAATSAVAAQ